MVEQNALKKLLKDPKFLFGALLGGLVCYLILFYPIIIIGAVIITAMLLFAFRDKMDFSTLSIKKAHELKPCDECGSRTKHRKGCSLAPGALDPLAKPKKKGKKNGKEEEE